MGNSKLGPQEILLLLRTGGNGTSPRFDMYQGNTTMPNATTTTSTTAGTMRL